MQWLPNEKYGNGSDGALSISENTTESPIDSSCSGAVDGKSLSATNASFVAGQIILIHQSRGTGAGQWELNVIDSYTAGTITTKYNLAYTYTDSGSSQAQVRVLKQYSSVTVDDAYTYASKAWDRNVGGILAFMCNGTTTITGTVNVKLRGYRAGQRETNDLEPTCGEGTVGDRVEQKTTANGSGGGSGTHDSDDNVGGGGGNATAGGTGSGSGGTAGTEAGAADLTNMVFGGGAGGNSDAVGELLPGIAYTAPGLVAIFSKEIVITGVIDGDGSNGATQTGTGGSGSAGGSILIKSNIATLGTNLVHAIAGTGSAGTGGKANGAVGSVGRIALHYGTSYTGTTTPAADITQDSNLIDVSPLPTFHNP